MRKFLLSVSMVIIFILGACAPRYGVTCPPLKEYSSEDQTKAAEEYSKAGPMIQTLVDDYGKLRNTIRICESKKAKY